MLNRPFVQPKRTFRRNSMDSARKLGAHSRESLRNPRSQARFAPARLSRPCYFVDACISRAQTHEIAWIPSKAPLRNTSKIASLRRAAGAGGWLDLRRSGHSQCTAGAYSVRSATSFS